MPLVASIFAAHAAWGDGLNEAEATINLLPWLVGIAAWAAFFQGLRTERRGRRRFYALVFLHLAPLPILIDCSDREVWQFLRWIVLGGAALVIGLPHFFWERGARMRPRLATAAGVAVALGGLLAYGLVAHAR